MAPRDFLPLVFNSSIEFIITKDQSIKELITIPSIGRSIANDLWNIAIASVADLKDKDPELLFDLSNRYASTIQNRCLLYSFHCAVYYAETKPDDCDPEKLKWWNCKDKSWNLSKGSRKLQRKVVRNKIGGPL
jgi:hypothetical protein